MKEYIRTPDSLLHLKDQFFEHFGCNAYFCLNCRQSYSKELMSNPFLRLDDPFGKLAICPHVPRETYEKRESSSQETILAVPIRASQTQSAENHGTTSVARKIISMLEKCGRLQASRK